MVSSSLLFRSSFLVYRRSAPINIHDVGSVHFRLFPPGETTREPTLIRADVALEGATVHIILNAEAGSWPFVIDNNSDYDISFCQIVRMPFMTSKITGL